MANKNDSTAYLQNLLDKGGNVVFPSGEYVISDSLKIHDNTKLSLAPDTVIKLADHACCTMLMNDQCGKEGANRRITIEGGVWDGNNLMQQRGKIYPDKPYFFGVVMRFEGIYDLTLRDMVIKDPDAFAFQLRFADRFTVENITFDFNMAKPNMDGVHLNGPARNGFIRNLKGATNDDLVAINCDDGYDDGEQFTKTMGDIENIEVNGLFADNCYTGVRLLSCGSVLRNVSIKNIFGTYRFYGVSFTHHSTFPDMTSWFDGISIQNVFCSKMPQTPPVDQRCIETVDKTFGEGIHAWAIKHAPIIWFEEGVKCGNVFISNINRIEEAITEAPTIQIDENATIDNLCITNVFQKFVNCEEVPLIVNNGNANIKL